MVSFKCYVRPNGIVNSRGAIPVIIAEIMANDQITDSDPVLDYILKMILAGQ